MTEKSHRTWKRSLLWFIIGNLTMGACTFSCSQIKYDGVVIKRPINEQLRDWFDLPSMEEKETKRQTHPSRSPTVKPTPSLHR